LIKCGQAVRAKDTQTSDQYKRAGQEKHENIRHSSTTVPRNRQLML